MSRTKQVAADLGKLTRNWDMAFSGRYDDDFKALQMGQTPPMQFNARFNCYEIWANEGWYKKQVEQLVEIVMSYRRAVYKLLISRQEYIEAWFLKSLP